MGLVDEVSVLKRQLEFCEHAPRLGFVYVIGNDSNQLVKIGTSGFSEIEKRVRALETMSPVRLWLRYLMPGDYYNERRAHESLASARRHGEWFDISTGEVDEYFVGSAVWREPTWLTCDRRCSPPVYTCKPRPQRPGRWEWRGRWRVDP